MNRKATGSVASVDTAIATAHCGSALMRVVEGRFEEGVFSPECNERDIAERAGWSHAGVVDEL